MAKAPQPAADLALKEDPHAESVETETEGRATPPADNEVILSSVGDGQDTVRGTFRVLTDEDLEPGWSTMDSAPTTGKAVRLAGLLQGIPLICPAYCHNSRRYTGSAMRWQNFSEWRILNTPTAVPFEPLAWSRHE